MMLLLFVDTLLLFPALPQTPPSRPGRYHGRVLSPAMHASNTDIIVLVRPA
jgi:hypothetical protein